VTSPDERLSRATDELRSQLSDEPIPGFSPNPRVSGEPAAPVPTALPADTSRPVSPDPDLAPQPPEPGSPTPTVAPAIGAEMPMQVYPEPTRLTDAGAGEFIAPLPLVGAFNANETLVVLYRTGSVNGGHIVVDTGTGTTIAEIGEIVVEAPDIEHVYWNPLAAGELVWLNGTSFVRHDVWTGTQTVVTTSCDAVTTGPFPAPPSATGAFPVACQRGDVWSLDLLDVTNQTSTTGLSNIGDIVSTIEEIRISPSGRLLAISSSATSTTSVFDLTTGTESASVTTNDAPIAWVAMPAGIEALTLPAYNGIGPGTIVVARPGGETTVVVGPDAGDEYPPTGTHLSATTLPDSEGRIVATVRGPADADSTLTGQVIVADIVDLPDGTVSTTVETFGHGGATVNGYWSSNTVSISPSGNRLVWATDEGTDSTNTFILDLTR